MFRFIPTRSRIGNCQKIAKKCKNLKKHDYGFISSQNGTGQAENDTKKKNVIVPIHSNPTRKREFQKNSKKIQEIKKKKNHYGLFSSQNVTGQTENERKKSYRSDPFQPNPELGILKKEQKISKN